MQNSQKVIQLYNQMCPFSFMLNAKKCFEYLQKYLQIQSKSYT